MYSVKSQQSPQGALYGIIVGKDNTKKKKSNTNTDSDFMNHWVRTLNM